MSRSQRTKPDRTGQLEIFPTPSWPVYRLLDRLNPKPGHWFEPAAGEGHIVRAVDAWLAARGRTNEIIWTTSDIRPTPYAQPPADMTQAIHPFVHMAFDVVISNPPFSKAQAMFEVCWPLVKRALVFLLPVSWLGSGDRAVLLRELTPNLFVLPERPIFRGDGTDQEIYAWFVWAKTLEKHPSRLEILPPTPVEERRASEHASADEMPADWKAEVEARKAARIARERERRSRV
jgi:hypothetical protein